MILTLKELADYLRVNERTILRMLKSGQIQGAKIGGQWRFNGSQIDSLFFSESEDEENRVPLADFTKTHIGIPVSRVMSKNRMILDIQATDRDGALKELANPSLLNSVLLDVQQLYNRLHDREQLLSTGVGNGIAIPHPRDPITTLGAPAVIVFGRSKKGVDFNAMDGKPVQLFFMLCSQNIELHLHLMGRLAQILRNPEFITNCMAAETNEDVMRQVLDFERHQFLRGGTQT